jgi:hypothetical protein
MNAGALELSLPYRESKFIKGMIMKRILIAVISMLFAGTLAAQAGPQTCDVTYTTDVNTADGNDAGLTVNTIPALPMADVLANNALGKKIINETSKQQDKGGPYTINYTETRVCGGGAPVKADGIFVKGVTLRGTNRIADAAIQAAQEMMNRYKDRSDNGAKVAWDHTKAKKVKLDPDTGMRIRD